jgi:6-phosphogluconolactonase
MMWTASDERYVPLSSEDSNFGNGIRHLLSPLGFSEDKFLPWPVELEPVPGAMTYQSQWANRFGSDRCFDLCMLGVGEDCHTASLFPGSPLLESPPDAFFAAVDVPGKGWRYTVTPKGLAACGEVVVMIFGAGKREALKRVLSEPIQPVERPLQVLATLHDKVTLLCDFEAVEGLEI